MILYQVETLGKNFAAITVLPDKVNELGEQHLTHAVEFRRSGIISVGNLAIKLAGHVAEVKI